MATLCVLLAIGLGFTANYDWAFSTGKNEPNYGDAAICYIRISGYFHQGKVEGQPLDIYKLTDRA
ncbi:tRNA processing endoribonuclease Trz1 [Aspergillus luchuensis]|uniref:tRNA processing endoribonuclease Trz1 n=1 Tax=Aspergillus kawachii TaxID=1069201 RepID=A0A146FKR8_ASPKA|nr:tRNA processing endoribonuclease Trz1 [Aspergillus luchuensis]